MKNPNDGFIKGRLKAVIYSLKGIGKLINTESSFQVQLAMAIIVTVLGFYFSISPTEWMIQFLVIGMVLVAEALNTAIEKLADFIEPKYNEKIGNIKDISAGAAGIGAIISLILACIIYLPKFEITF